ncbi:hypothetical protein KP22_02760 [Pectobacterium betavasculorum]|uniref:Uncharacterized protein n=1 Tax=Pectobacterium betavasculorum TaxID=55207 RepID=A0A093TJJ5_9GAMM|nr:hypothetical protein [Pectobacterium betavasculorum]KFX07027.1 hypothetical protein KP22_02760 [Pectobacterium betavasculorum]KFX22606.1 hypothetical protein JV35_05410 [Pectobacterium betavasculorum]
MKQKSCFIIFRQHGFSQGMVFVGGLRVIHVKMCVMSKFWHVSSAESLHKWRNRMRLLKRFSGIFFETP